MAYAMIQWVSINNIQTNSTELSKFCSQIRHNVYWKTFQICGVALLLSISNCNNWNSVHVSNQPFNFERNFNFIIPKHFKVKFFSFRMQTIYICFTFALTSMHNQVHTKLLLHFEAVHICFTKQQNIDGWDEYEPLYY